VTCLANIYTSSAIVMAADTFKTDIKDYVDRTPLGNSLVQKLFYINRTKTGISAKGMATCNAMSVIQILQEFVRTTDLGDEDQTQVAISSQFLKQYYPGLENRFLYLWYTGPCSILCWRIEHSSNGIFDHINIDHFKATKYDISFRCTKKHVKWVRKTHHRNSIADLNFQECITGWKKCFDV